MHYSVSIDIIFVVLTLISSFALLSEHLLTSAIFFISSIIFIFFEHQIYNYINS